jgi:hypothetical protein
MPPGKKKKTLTEKKLQQIIAKYDQGRLQVSRAYCDGGIDGVWPRFERAASNQCVDGDATLSRYAIWANTVRDNIIEALQLMERGNAKDAAPLLILAANSLSAFSDVQAYFDPFDIGTIETE